MFSSLFASSDASSSNNSDKDGGAEKDRSDEDEFTNPITDSWVPLNSGKDIRQNFLVKQLSYLHPDNREQPWLAESVADNQARVGQVTQVFKNKLKTDVVAIKVSWNDTASHGIPDDFTLGERVFKKDFKLLLQNELFRPKFEDQMKGMIKESRTRLKRQLSSERKEIAKDRNNDTAPSAKLKVYKRTYKWGDHCGTCIGCAWCKGACEAVPVCLFAVAFCPCVCLTLGCEGPDCRNIMRPTHPCCVWKCDKWISNSCEMVGVVGFGIVCCPCVCIDLSIEGCCPLEEVKGATVARPAIQMHVAGTPQHMDR